VSVQSVDSKRSRGLVVKSSTDRILCRCINMSDRMNTLVCIFDPSSPTISAYNIHDCIHEALRLMEEDIQVIQVDGPRRRVFIKF